MRVCVCTVPSCFGTHIMWYSMFLVWDPCRPLSPSRPLPLRFISSLYYYTVFGQFLVWATPSQQLGQVLGGTINFIMSVSHGATWAQRRGARHTLAAADDDPLLSGGFKTALCIEPATT